MRIPKPPWSRILERYHAIADRCDAVVVVGSDYTDVGSPAEFAFNARIAANLGVPVLLVLNGAGRDVEQVRTAASLAETELAANQASLFAVIANRVDPASPETYAAALARPDVPAFALPEGRRRGVLRRDAARRRREPHDRLGHRDLQRAGFEGANKQGVGLYVDAGSPVAVRQVDVATTSTPGFTAAVYGANDVPDGIDGWTKLSSDLTIAAEQDIPLDTGGQSFRYYLLWITELPGDGKAAVKELSVLE